MTYKKEEPKTVDELADEYTWIECKWGECDDDKEDIKNIFKAGYAAAMKQTLELLKSKEAIRAPKKLDKLFYASDWADWLEERLK